MLRRARLRYAAHTAVQEPGALPVMQPCTLPCSLLDEQLGLSTINFRGPEPRLIYTARQRGVAGAADRHVLVKFVDRRYGAEVRPVRMNRTYRMYGR
jgi:hypothetical protein